MNQKAQEAAEVKTFKDGSTMVVVPPPSASPFGALAGLKKNSPAVDDTREVRVQAPTTHDAAVPAEVPVADVVADNTISEEQDQANVAAIHALFPAPDEVSEPVVEAPKVETPKVEPRQEKPKSQRTPFQGIRKIEIPVIVAPMPRPSGSIRLPRFLQLGGARHLTHIASEVAATGATPDVVVWSKSKSGFDIVRIRVVLYEAKVKGGQSELRSYLEITEATGRYKDLAQYIGKKIFFSEVMGFKSQDPKRRDFDQDRAVRTKALNTVLVEADKHLREAEARRKESQRAGKSGKATQEAGQAQ